MSYLNQFMQQWKAHLKSELAYCGLRFITTEDGDEVDVKTNSLAYFRCLRLISNINDHLDESRDSLAWMMLEKQLKAKAEMAERGTSSLVAKLHIEASQIEIRLNFSYDEEQHIVLVS
ncbi:hypothetical protein [Marinomonas spartinae]|uniref:hypothetical protein n=1 Tax=Marinomonas spartinae TaxID=1792290 RepID=UPI001F390741|nr:hypothetical protein [Marinomonas spartinae]